MRDSIFKQKQKACKTNGRSARKWLCSTSFVVLAVAMPVGAACAQEWTGSVSTNWGNAANWQGGSLPTATSDVVINNEGAGWPVINGGAYDSHRVIIGDTADGGSLMLMGGGVLNTAHSVDIGLNYIGSATVTGGGTIWNIAEYLELGYAGTGTLTISNNGRVNSKDGYLSNRQQGKGTANVNSGGRWVNSGDLFAGYQGTGVLNIASGGLVAANRTFVGFYGPSTGTITIDGPTSLLTTGGFVVGREGRGTVTVSNDADIESASGILGEFAGSSGTVHLQTDADWQVSTAVTVGAGGAGTLTASGGSDITSQGVTLGRNTGGNGTVMLTGSGTSWVAGDFTIARDGIGLMTLGTAAVVGSDRVVIGQNTGSNGALNITTGGVWTSSGEVVVGDAGTGNLRIDVLGRVQSVGGKIGAGEGGIGAVEIVGTPHPSDRSIWNAGAGTVTVGGAGGQGTLTVRDAGAVISDNLTISASDANGFTGGATLNVTGGGLVVTDFNASLASSAGTRGSAVISGADSAWSASVLTVGAGGQGDLQIEDRGYVLVDTARIAGLAGSSGDVVISGDGSLLRATNFLYVGDGGQGSLTVENNGDLLSLGGRIGQGAASTGTVLVTGLGSQWNAKGALLSIGDGGNATVTVADQARLLADAINVGTSGASATITATSGASVESGALNIGAVSGRSGSVTITGAGTTWTASDGVAVGVQAGGSLTIAGGASLSSADSKIGEGVGASGNVLVTGANSVWNLGAGVVSVGGSGTGVLAVENGGRILGDVDVLSGGTLKGNGAVNDVLVSGGTLVGVQGQTLTINGGLTLQSTANVDVSLGAPGNATGLFKVNGDLRLDGTLNVTNGGGFGQGIYRIVDYTGSLTDNGMTVGAMPSGTSGTVQTAIAEQVNLLVSGFSNDTQFWNGTTTTADGTIHGGNGTWRAGPTNWTDVNGATASAWGNQFAVFQNTPGVIVVDDSAGVISTTGMQFVGQGWFMTGDPITLSGTGGNTAIRVGDGSIGGVAHVATIESDMTGNTRLVKDDLGTLILTGANTYSGGTTIAAGTLQIGNGSTAGSVAGDILNNGTLAFNHTGAKTYADDISGSGSLAVQAGQLILTGTNSYTGGTTIAGGGRLRIGDGITSGAIVGNVVANGDLRFNNTGATSFGGAISGSGQITLATGDLTLSGNSSSFAGFTQLQGGTLRLNGTLGGVGMSVTNGATLTGTGSTTAAVDIQNTGTLAGTQGQTLTTGSMTLASGSNVNVALGAPGNSVGLFAVNGDLTLDGTLNVSDAGGFGMGVYRIFDYTGSLTNNGLDVGTMPLGTSGTVQTAMANQVNLVVDGGGPVPTMQFWNGTTTTADGTIHGGDGVWSAGPTTNWTNLAGSTAGAWGDNFAVFQSNPGNVTVDDGAGTVSTTGMQFIGNGWNVAGDAIALNGTGGNTTVRVGDGSNASHSATISSELTGNSRLVKDDLGTLILTGTNSYTGGTTIAAGTLQIGDIGTSGSITGNVLNNGLLRFSRTDATTFGGLISGSGAVHVAHGQLTLTGDNTYAGDTTIGGVASLTLGNGGTTGSVTGNIVNNGQLRFNRSNDFTYTGVLSGFGAIRQIGSGKTELTGNSSGYTGPTTVENGILAVNGQLGGSLDVWAGGRLQGTGTVGNTIVSGVIAPGNSIGTLNVGNITFNAGSTYEVEVNAAGQSDKILASGTATINGGAVQVLAGAGNYAPATTYTILTANGGRTGTFTGGVTSNLAFLDPSLSYDANNVYLTMTRNGTGFQNVGITPNQIATGYGTESLGLGNPVHDAVLNLSAPQAQYAFDQLSGEVHASAISTLVEDSRFVRNAAWDRIRAGEDGKGYGVWGQGFGSWGHTNSNGNAAKTNRSTGGFFVGVDGEVFDNARFGAIAGYSRTSFDVKDRASSGSSDNYHLGLYGGTEWGAVAFRSGLAYTWHDMDTTRNVAFPGFSDRLTAGYNAGTFQAFTEVGYGIDLGTAKLEPFANLAYVNFDANGFTEKGGAASLANAGGSTDTTFTTLGLRASTSFSMGETTVTAKGMLGWRHAFGDTAPSVAMTYASGGNAFAIGGVPLARNLAVVEAGLDFALSPAATLGVSYGGQFGSGIVDQSFRANLNVKF